MNPIEPDPQDLTDEALEQICKPYGQRIRDLQEPEYEQEPEHKDLDDMDFMG